MRENERRIGGLQWGMFSIFEAAEPRTSRTIDQSIVAWRLASINHGAAVFENPRSTIQRTVNMITGGSNREHHAAPIIYRRRAMTVGEVRARMEACRNYPTAAEVSEIQRRFHSPELEHAMEVARQEIIRRYWPRNVLIDPEPPRWAQNPDGSLERVD